MNPESLNRGMVVPAELRDIVQTAFAAEDGDDRCPQYLEDLLRQAAGLTGGEPEAMIDTASAKADDKYVRFQGSVSYDELLCDYLIRAIIGVARAAGMKIRTLRRQYNAQFEV